MFAGTAAGRPVGNIWLDVSARGCELGWIIAPEWRGHGIGKAMVMAAIKMIPLDQLLWCKMRDDNIASSRLARNHVDFACAEETARCYFWSYHLRIEIFKR